MVENPILYREKSLIRAIISMMLLVEKLLLNRRVQRREFEGKSRGLTEKKQGCILTYTLVLLSAG